LNSMRFIFFLSRAQTRAGQSNTRINRDRDLGLCKQCWD